MTTKNPFISIVTGYYNRKPQTIKTLEQYQNLYADKYDFEVIIVDDFSNDENKLEDIINHFDFKIKLIKVIDKKWINPVIPYNIGFQNIHPKTEYIVIQNPEIFHCGNIFEHVLNNIKEDEYYTYPVFASPDFIYNEELYNIKENYNNNFISRIDYNFFHFDYDFYKEKYPDTIYLKPNQAYRHFMSVGRVQKRICNKYNIFYTKGFIETFKGWYNHKVHNPCNYHFLSALHKNTLHKIGGFCEEMKDGYWYDDNDFLNRLKKSCNVKLVDSNTYLGIHQYHDNGLGETFKRENFQELAKKNKDILHKNDNENIIHCPFTEASTNANVNIIMNDFYKK